MSSVGVKVRISPLPGMLHAASIRAVTTPSSAGRRRQRACRRPRAGLTAMAAAISIPKTPMGRWLPIMGVF